MGAPRSVSAYLMSDAGSSCQLLERRHRTHSAEEIRRQPARVWMDNNLRLGPILADFPLQKGHARSFSHAHTIAWEKNVFLQLAFQVCFRFCFLLQSDCFQALCWQKWGQTLCRQMQSNSSASIRSETTLETKRVKLTDKNQQLSLPELYLKKKKTVTTFEVLQIELKFIVKKYIYFINF